MLLLLILLISSPVFAFYISTDKDTRHRLKNLKLKNYKGVSRGKIYLLIVILFCILVSIFSFNIFDLFFKNLVEKKSLFSAQVFILFVLASMLIHYKLIFKFYCKNELAKKTLILLLFINMCLCMSLFSFKFNISKELFPTAFSLSFFCFMYFPFMIGNLFNDLD